MRSELDITDRDAVNRSVTDLSPDLLFNCAVLQVDDSERDPAKARAVNTAGPGYLAEAVARVGGEIVQFSTQYVFAGEPVGRAPYTVDDAPCPINVYGQTKLDGEQSVRQACPRSYIIRTSWVFGSGKATFLCDVHEQLRERKRVRAIDDIWSSTTYVEDLIERCLEITSLHHYATYHVVNSGVCSYLEFASEAARQLGLSRQEVDELIEVTHERDMRRIAMRPRYTPLRCLVSEKLGLAPMRDWRKALAAHVGG